MHQPIYLDYAATTPVAPEVAERMGAFLTMDGVFANPASRAHVLGWQAEEAVETARGQVAQLIGADPREIIFTSGATEANNLALKGYLASITKTAHSTHVVTTAVEHKAVLDPCHWLSQRGAQVTTVQPTASGWVTADAILNAMRDDTVLVSMMHVNNETGAINPVAEVGAECRRRGVAFHVDAAQSAGKLPLRVSELNVDLLSLSAHKFYGPKGVGALYVRRAPEMTIEAQIHGGGHERGMRSGTLPTHQIVGLGEAAALAERKMVDDGAYIARLSQRFWDGVSQMGATLNGDFENKLPGILNLCFGARDGEELLFSLQGLAVSTGSACTSASVEPSYVLKAMGVSDEWAHGSLRFSLGRYTTIEDIDKALNIIQRAVIRDGGAQ